jgi:hypothetical protein
MKNLVHASHLKHEMEMLNPIQAAIPSLLADNGVKIGYQNHRRQM